MPTRRLWLVDLKTAASANPRARRDQTWRLGYHARAAWYLDGAETVFGQAPEEYRFIIVENGVALPRQRHQFRCRGLGVGAARQPQSLRAVRALVG